MLVTISAADAASGNASLAVASSSSPNRDDAEPLETYASPVDRMKVGWSVKVLWWVVLLFLLTVGIAVADVHSSKTVPPALWQRAAAKLKMPVFWPTETFGTRLKEVVPMRV